MTTKRRDLYIVSTDRRDLYELFRKQFDDDPNVEVIFDRRRGERRAARGATPEERRRADRRQFEQAHLLTTLGVVLVSREHRAEIARAHEAPAPAKTTKPPGRAKAAKSSRPGRGA
jgi:hypothetical protein